MQFKDKFDNYNIETINSYDIQMNDVSIENSDIGLVKLDDEFTHVFDAKASDGDKYILKFSRQFMYLDIYPSMNYKGTDIYYKLFAKVFGILKSVEYFNINRVGLRKFNNFFIEEDKVSKLKDIFSDDSFSLWIPENYKLRRKKTMTDVYVEEILSLNFIKEISYGMFENGKSVYLVAFDFDIYSNNESFLSEFTSTIESKLDEMNECAFEFFLRKQ